MPGLPTSKESTKSNSDGQFKWIGINANRGATAFTVTYADYPDKVLKRYSADQILANIVAATLAARPTAVKIKDASVVLQGFPSKDFDLEDSSVGYTTIGRLYLAGNRVYLLQVNKPIQQSMDEDIRRFRDSFKILPN